MEADKEHPEKLFDFKQLEAIAEGNQEFFIGMSKIFVDTSPGNSAELVEATKAADWNKTFQLAHKLKSTIDSLNIHSIKRDIRSLEIDAKNKVNTVELKRLAVKVDTVIRAVAEQLKNDFLI